MPTYSREYKLRLKVRAVIMESLNQENGQYMLEVKRRRPVGSHIWSKPVT